MEWFKKFWQAHGDRLAFAGMAFSIAVGLWVFVPDMQGEAKTIIIGVAMLLFNKARGVEKSDDAGYSVGPIETYSIKGATKDE